MSRAWRRVASWTLVAVDAAALLAPALAVVIGSSRVGLGPGVHLDVIVSSVVVAIGHAVLTARRLAVCSPSPPTTPEWIATGNGVVVLAVAASGLPPAVFTSGAVPVGAILDAGAPVVVVWLVVLAGAIVLAETARRLVRRYLAPEA
jgi:hypothetical protein